MSISTTATQAEMRALWEATVKLEKMVAPYASGAATPTVPGRFTIAEVDAMLVTHAAAVTAASS